MHNEIEYIIKKCLLSNIYLALIKIYLKFDTIKYILFRSKHQSKSTLIMFAFSKITLVIKRVNSLSAIRGSDSRDTIAPLSRHRPKRVS